MKKFSIFKNSMVFIFCGWIFVEGYQMYLYLFLKNQVKFNSIYKLILAAIFVFYALFYAHFNLKGEKKSCIYKIAFCGVLWICSRFFGAFYSFISLGILFSLLCIVIAIFGIIELLSISKKTNNENIV